MRLRAAIALVSAAFLALPPCAGGKEKPAPLRTVAPPPGFEDSGPPPATAPAKKDGQKDEKTAGKPAAPGIRSDTPSGFEELEKPRPLLVDVFYDGQRLGQTVVIFAKGKLRVKDAAQFQKLLPGLRNAEGVAAALKTELPANTDKVCRTRPNEEPAECRPVETPNIAFVLDESRLRLDLHFHPRHMDSRTLGFRKYLGASDAGPSFVSQINANLAGTLDQRPALSAQTYSALSYRDARLRADINFDLAKSWQADAIAVEIDKPGWRYQGGFFRGLGSQILPDVKYYGIGVGTSTDTRVDLDQATGSQLTVLLRRPAFVDILRDGRLLSSRLYQPGTRVLDTSQLPAGAYNVTLRIREIGGAEREEVRFFAKTEMIPPADQPQFFVHAGTLAKRSSFRLPPPSQYPIGKAIARVRITDGLAIGVEAAGTRREGAFEGSVFYVSPLGRFTVSGLATTALDWGIGASVAGGYRDFGFALSARYVKSRRGAGPTDLADGKNDDPRHFRFAPGNTVQLAGSISYQLERARIGVSGQYRRSYTAGVPDTYSVGPTVDVRLWQNPTHQVLLGAEFYKTERGYAGMARLSWRWQAPKGVTVTAETGVRSVRSRPTQDETREFVRVDATWQAPPVLDHEFTLRPSIQRDGPTSFGLDATSRGPSGRAHAAIRQTYDGGRRSGRWSTAYGVGYATGIAIDRSGIAFGGRDAAAAGVIARIEGPASAGRYNVIVDGSPRTTVAAGSTVPIFLAPYRTYEIGIAPASTDQPLASVQASVRQVTLYPGNVQTLRWSVEPITVVFGRILDAAGQPIANAAIEGAVGTGETDAQGYFQIEINKQKSIKIKTDNGKYCDAVLPQLKPKDGLARVGPLRCT